MQSFPRVCDHSPMRALQVCAQLEKLSQLDMCTHVQVCGAFFDALIVCAMWIENIREHSRGAATLLLTCAVSIGLSTRVQSTYPIASTFGAYGYEA